MALVGAVLLLVNLGATLAALEFLSPSGQDGRGGYVDARATQAALVEARGDEAANVGSDGKFSALVSGIASDPRLQERVVLLTDEQLSNNDWLTPSQRVASPLWGLIGIGLLLFAGGGFAVQLLSASSNGADQDKAGVR